MKKIILIFLSLLTTAYTYAQTLSVDPNGVLNLPKLVAQTTAGQIFFTGHQLGSTYSMPDGIFRAWTDNSNGRVNYYYDGVTNGTVNYYVRADGQGYFAGRVGVGNANPSAPLEITGGNVSTSIGNVATTLSMRINTANPAISLGIGYLSSDNPMIQSFNNVNNSVRSISLNPFGGNVGIGTTQPDQALTVSGTIHATEVLVDANVPHPDYVFDKEYDLVALKDVKTYIDKNHHLPEIPSAAQVAREGINLGEMNAKLLKKIEELTLYLIEKDKEIQKQQSQLQLLNQKMKSMEKKLSVVQKF